MLKKLHFVFSSFLISLTLLYHSPSYSQLTIDTLGSAAFPTAGSMVDKIFYNTDAFIIQNIRYFGVNSAIGYFKFNNYPSLDIQEGMIISTGKIANAFGPSTLNASGINNVYEKPDSNIMKKFSDAIGFPDSILYDLAMLEIEIKINDQCHPIEMQYMFGSEEYPFTGSKYYDAFAIMVEGVNPVTRQPYNGDNFALYTINGNQFPVSINNINQGTRYYIPNTGNDFTYNGFTDFDSIKVNILVWPCDSIYTIRIMIADVADSLKDSGLFFQFKGFSARKDIPEKPLTASLSCDKEMICPDEGESAVLSIDTAGGWGYYEYQWFSSPLDDTLKEKTGRDTIRQVAVPEETTTYYVKIVDACGLEKETNRVELIVRCETQIPNVFTPNGDGKNDFFEIKNIDDHKNSTLIVYNRYGKKAYESQNYEKANLWNGENQPDGVYYYIFKRSDGKTFTGVVHIVR